MSSERRIDFVASGGTTTGMGHVMRCVSLAAEARSRGWIVRAYIDGPSSVRERWADLTNGPPAERWSTWKPGPRRSLVVLDYPDDKQSWLDRLEKHDQQSLVIDDPNPRERATWTLLPALHHACDAHARLGPSPRSGGEKVLAGPRYSIISRVHLDLPHRPFETRSRLLLSMGGADPHHVTPQLAPLIRQALENSSRPSAISGRDVVLGPAFDDPGGREAARLEAEGWNVLSAIAPAEMAERMRASRIAVIGFGTSLGELAYHRTPFLTVTHHDHDRAPARDLEAEGIGRVLGTASALDPRLILRRLTSALDDAAWQESSAEAAYRLIEGGVGAQRIFEAIEKDALVTGATKTPASGPASSSRATPPA